jgi:hypothetical protein
MKKTKNKKNKKNGGEKVFQRSNVPTKTVFAALYNI